MNPNQVAWAIHLRNALRERCVHRRIRWPVRVRGRVLRRDILPKQVVEQWPEGCGAQRIGQYLFWAFG